MSHLSWNGKSPFTCHAAGMTLEVIPTKYVKEWLCDYEVVVANYLADSPR